MTRESRPVDAIGSQPCRLETTPADCVRRREPDRAPKESELWQRPVYVELVRRLEAELRDEDPGHAAARIQFSLQQPPRMPGKAERELYRLGVALAGLRFLAGTEAHAEQGDALAEIALRVLKSRGIRPRRSRMTFVYGEAFTELSRVREAQGRGIEAAWLRLVADHCDPGAEPRSDAPAGEGNPPLDPAQWAANADAQEDADPLVRIRLLRLCGDPLGAARAARELVSEHGSSLATRWQHALSDSRVNGSLAALFELRSAAASDPSCEAELGLWCHAMRSRAWAQRYWRGRPRRPTTSGDADTARANEVLAFLAPTRADPGSLLDRLTALGEHLAAAHRMTRVEWRLLVLAGAVRWLRRARQPVMAQWIADHYAAVSRRVTRGLTADALGAGEDLVEDQPPDAAPVDPTWSARALGATRLFASVATGLGRARLQSLLRPGKRAKRLADHEIEAITRAAADHLCELRGPMLKFGQHLSYLGLPIPEGAHKALADTRDGARAVPFDTVRSVIEEELGTSIERAFPQLNPIPIGVGSIGQVHAGRLPDGRAVAVKVQYPGVRGAIDADLRSLAALLPFAKIFMRHLETGRVVDELRDQLRRECDYALELRWQRAFRERFADCDSIYIPEPIETHSGARVLTSELVEGLSLPDFRRVSTEKERVRAAEAISFFVMRGWEDGVMNCDPHPGNYLFGEDRVCFVDYGCVKQLHGEHARGAADQVRVGLHRDYKLFRESALRLGMPVRARQFDYEYMYEVFMRGSLGKLAEDVAVTYRHREVLDDLAKLVSRDNPNLSNFRLAPEFLMAYRCYFGHLLVLAELGCPVNVREVALRAIAPRQPSPTAD